MTECGKFHVGLKFYIFSSFEHKVFVVGKVKDSVLPVRRSPLGFSFPINGCADFVD